MRTAPVLVVALVAVVCSLAFGTASAHAAFGISSFKAQVLKADGSEETRAGVHPYAAMTEFSLHQDRSDPGGAVYPDGMLRNLTVDLPAGFVGDPSAVPTCPRVDALGLLCSPATQVGVITLKYLIVGSEFTETVGVYNMVRARGEVANFGFTVLAVPLNIKISLRSDGDYGVRATMTNISQAIPVTGTKLILWGTPADPSHDPQRGGKFDCFADVDDPSCAGPGVAGGFSAGVEPKPFLTNPTLCGPPVDTKLTVSSWEDRTATSSAVSTTSTGPTECNKLNFEPTIDATPDTTRIDAASGLSVKLHLPDNDNPNGRATPTLKRAVVTLPEGMSIAPAAADGLTGCSDAQVGFGTLSPVACPSTSKIGDAEILSPVLSEPLQGGIYLGEPLPNQMFRIFMTADNTNYGISIRVEGKLYPDPVTGQLKTVFDDNPALPFSDLTLKFKGGSRAPLSTPVTCGTKTTTAELTPYAALDVTPVTTSSTFQASFDGNGAPCPGMGFAPGFDAGTTDPGAARDTTFSMSLSRADREQTIKDIGLTMPAGLLGRIAATTLCAEAQAAAGTCGEASRIGSSTVTSGAGTSPFTLGGKVYVTGPYKGAPFGLSIVVPAKAGPFDLGTVVVRSALLIDPDTTAVRVVSDPLPSILKGVPSRLKLVNVTIDRPGFMVNPTNCTASSIAAAVSSAAPGSPISLDSQQFGFPTQTGIVAQLANRFQASGCAALPFKPELSLTVGTPRNTSKATKAKTAKAKAAAKKAETTTPAEMRDGGHPPLSAHLTVPSGNANQSKVTVTLPLALAIDPDNANGLCEPTAAAADSCPAASIVGNVVARSPMLNGTLSGPAYFVRGETLDARTGRIRKTLPKLYVPLRSSDHPGLQINLRASSDVKSDRLVTTFDAIPDAAVSDFDLTITGGQHGILVISGTDACATAQYTDVDYVAQSNRRLHSTIGVQTACPLAIVSSSHSSTALNVGVSGLAPGKVTVTGTGARKVSKTIATPTYGQTFSAQGRVQQTVAATTNASLALKLSKAQRSALARGRDVKVKVTVSFVAKGAKKATKTTKTLTVHGAKTSKK